MKIKIKFENWGWYRLGVKVGRFERIIYLKRPIWAIQRAIRAIQHSWYDLTGQTIYGIWWSRDCDMCEGYTKARYNNQRALDRAYEDAAREAEGPFSFEQCSREEYEEFKEYSRDRVLEAFENGNGRSIYV